MHGSSIKNILAQPDVNNVSIINKQKVMTKRNNKIESRINELTKADVEVIARPNNEWRVNKNININNDN
jgi:hypothetical protein